MELEAYIGLDDQASHARFGRTDRNRVMFGPPGVAYVYLVYGMYDCLNIVTEPTGAPAALLVRAVEPVEGIDAMRSARLAWSGRRRKGMDAAGLAREAARLEAVRPHRLASGPGLVAAAFSLDRSATGVDMCSASSWLRLEPAPPSEPRPTIVAGARVGIAYAGEPWTERPWRVAIAGSQALSSAALR